MMGRKETGGRNREGKTQEQQDEREPSVSNNNIIRTIIIICQSRQKIEIQIKDLKVPVRA